MRGLVFSLVFLLAACMPKPGIEIRTVEKPVLVIEKCIKKEDAPVLPSPLQKPIPSDLETALSVALAKVSEWTRYGAEASTIINGCY